MKEGSHEAKVFHAIPASGLNLADLKAKVGEAATFGQAKAFKNKWIRKDGTVLFKMVMNAPLIVQVDAIVDQTQLDLKEIHATGALNNENIKDLKKRKLIDKR